MRQGEGLESLHISEEIQRRFTLWATLKDEGLDDLEPQLLRDLRIYGGAQGVWVDKSQTAPASKDGHGITVGLRHTGKHYNDELSEDGLIYHYPETGRQSGRDQAEIQATKNAMNEGVPLFVIFPGKKRATRRSVQLGWVTDFDDIAAQFLIVFGESQPKIEGEEADTPFFLEAQSNSRKSLTKQRPGQQKFRFDVLKNYGCTCAVCSISHPKLVKAAHIRGKGDNGSDDWRNGIPLCATHHDAFDAHLFGVEPTSLKLIFAPGCDGHALGIAAKKLQPLRNKPHGDAISWRWAQSQSHWGTISR